LAGSDDRVYRHPEYNQKQEYPDKSALSRLFARRRRRRRSAMGAGGLIFYRSIR
jgi:hypothetical protein